MKRSRFFCENCHKEVKPNARVCPHCGRFFTAVRCPVCSYVGQATEFTAGCPSCGYSAGANDAAGIEIVSFDRNEDQAAAGRGHPRSHTDRPGWVLPLAAVILTLAFVALAVVYVSLE